MIYIPWWLSSAIDVPHMRLILVDAPVNEPLTAAEARARLNIGSDVSDAVLDAYLMAARQTIDGADGWLGRALITQTWRGNLDCFPTGCGGRIYIPLPPLQTLIVSHLDSAGNPVTLVEGVDYKLVQAQRPYIVPLTAWPTITGIDGVTIEFTVGYGDNGDDVPEPIRTAIALGAGHIHHIASRNPAVTMEAEEGIGQTRYGVTKEVFQVIDDTVQSLLSTYRVIRV